MERLVLSDWLRVTLSEELSDVDDDIDHVGFVSVDDKVG